MGVKAQSNSKPVQVFCPLCQFTNTFWGIVDADGDIIEHTMGRCPGWELDEQGQKTVNDYRFSF